MLVCINVCSCRHIMKLVSTESIYSHVLVLSREYKRCEKIKSLCFASLNSSQKVSEYDQEIP